MGQETDLLPLRAVEDPATAEVGHHLPQEAGRPDQVPDPPQERIPAAREGANRKQTPPKKPSKRVHGGPTQTGSGARNTQTGSGARKSARSRSPSRLPLPRFQEIAAVFASQPPLGSLVGILGHIGGAKLA